MFFDTLVEYTINTVVMEELIPCLVTRGSCSLITFICVELVSIKTLLAITFSFSNLVNWYIKMYLIVENHIYFSNYFVGKPLISHYFCTAEVYNANSLQMAIIFQEI